MINLFYSQQGHYYTLPSPPQQSKQRQLMPTDDEWTVQRATYWDHGHFEVTEYIAPFGDFQDKQL